ncbi:MAG: hypothetical protein LBR29_06165, partial [Methylobacteriaceae bacterium]|nr:hypothetical protein [Methylobacteriaceae bacterium]
MDDRTPSETQGSAPSPLSPAPLARPDGCSPLGKLGVIAAVVIIGVLLLFPGDEAAGGFAFGVWLLVLAAAGLALRPMRVGSSRQWAALAAVLVLGVLPVLESLTWLSFLLSLI